MSEAKRDKPAARISEARVEELLTVAAEVFGEHGFDGASVNEMARRAGASKATFYSRYPTKEALLLAVMSRGVVDLEDTLAALMTKQKSVSDALSVFADRVLTITLSKRMLAIYRVVTLEAQRFPALGQAYFENGVAKGAAHLSKYLKQKRDEGVLAVPEPQLSAELFIDSIVGMPRLKASLGLETLSENEKKRRIAIAVQHFLAAHAL